jgi:hypothetical protein
MTDGTRVRFLHHRDCYELRMTMAKKPHRDSGAPKHSDPNQVGKESNVAANPDAPYDFAKVGPRSIEGVEASDLPDGGRGSVETVPGKELRRKLPQQTGAIGDATDVGLRGEPDVADANDHGHRKHN